MKLFALTEVWGHSALTWDKEDMEDITNCLGFKRGEN